MTIRAAIRAVVALASLAAIAPELSAHVSLYRAVPAQDSVVHGSPAEVRLWFTHTIEAPFSTLEVLDSSGRRVDKRDPRVDRSDPTLIRVSLPSLAPGSYRVQWRVVSVDTHVIKGGFSFAVQP